MTTSPRPDLFTVASDGCKLVVRSYVPEANAFPGAGVVLLHGISSSADIFDVPGLEAMSFARALARDGVHAVSYDQRGAGRSTARDWQFGLREHAGVDLPAVLAACRSRLGMERVVLCGYSLGGTISVRYLRARDHAAGGDGPDIVAGLAIASPSVFDRRYPPWADIARRGRDFLESIDRNRNGIVERAEFVAGQILLYWPWARPFANPVGLERMIAAGGRWLLAAGALRWSPTPTLIYHRKDFDNATFRSVLASHVLDRAPYTLFRDLVEEILGPPASPGTPLPLDVLCIGSTRDRLVPLRSVEDYAREFARARVVATEQVYGELSGHAGYFFKAGLREQVYEEVLRFVRASLAGKV
jgi:pimeloyl-ACP methyl ester carboxylesterase